MRKIKLIIVSFIIILFLNYLIPIAYAVENINENNINDIENNKIDTSKENMNTIVKETTDIKENNTESIESNVTENITKENEEEIEFASNELKEYLLNNYDANSDNKITQYDLNQITELELPYFNEIIDLKGLENAEALKKITLRDAKNFATLQNLKNLETIEIENIYSQDDYKSIKQIQNIKNITLYYIDFNLYSLLDLPTNITKLELNYCTIDNLEGLKSFLNLEEFELYGRQYSEKELIGLNYINELPNLKKLTINDLEITNLDFLNNNNTIEMLDISNNKITDISFISTMPKLKSIEISRNSIQDLSILENSPLIQDKYFAQNIILEGYQIEEGKTIEIDLPESIKSTFNSNSSFYMNDARIVNTSEDTDGKSAYINDNNTKIIINTEGLSIGQKEVRFELQGSGSLACSDIIVKYTVLAPGDKEQEISFASNELKNYLLENFDADKDGKITQFDMVQIIELNLPYFNETADLQGLEYATSLKKISIHNSKNIKVLQNLEDLEAIEIENINSQEDYQSIKQISNIKNITLNYIDFNSYSLLDLPTNISKLELNYCTIDSLEGIKSFSNLEELNIYGRQSSEKEIIGLNYINELPNLKKLTINYLEITNVDFLSNNNTIEMLNISNNSLTDISTIITMSKLNNIDISWNNIQDLSILENSPLLQDKYISQEIILDGYEIEEGETLEIDLPESIKAAFNSNSSFYMNDARIVKSSENTEGKGAYINENNTKIIINAEGLSIGQKEERFELEGSGNLAWSNITVKYTVLAPGDKDQEVSFVSDELKNYLLENYDADKDGKITQFDMAQIIELNLPYFENINLQGLEYATSLKKLYAINAKNLNVLTNLTNLEELDIENIFTQEDFIAIRNIPNIKKLGLHYINLNEYSLNELPTKIEKLTLSNCSIENIDNISRFNNLTDLEILGRQYSDKEIQGLSNINNLSNLKNLVLENLDLQNINWLENNNTIKTLDVSYNKITDISVIKSMTQLENAYFQYNNIQDITTLRGTKFIDSENNVAQRIQLTVEGNSGKQIEIDLPQTIKSALDQNDDLFYINNLRIDQSGKLSNGESKTIARISEDKTKIILDASGIDIASGTENLNFYGTGILDSTSIVISYKIYATGDNTKEVEFGDSNLKNYILQNYDIDKDGKVTEFDMAQIQDLSINNLSLNSVKGLGKAKNLTRLNIYINYNYENSELIPVDLSELANLNKLEYLTLSGNTMDMDFISSLQNLETLDINISYEKPDNIYLLENLPNLQRLYLKGKIETLDPISKLKNLTDLTINISNDNNLDFNALSELKLLTSLSLSGNFNLVENFNAIGKLTNLISFSIHRYNDINDTQKLDYSFLSKFSNIWTLSITDNYTEIDCDVINSNNLSHLNLRVKSLINTQEISNYEKLNYLSIEKSKLTNIDFVRNLKVYSLVLDNNFITDLSLLENLNIDYVDLTNNPIDPENEANARVIKLYDDNGKDLILTEYEKTKNLEFEDNEFKNELLRDDDLNGDGEISIYEMEQIDYLTVNNLEHAEYLINLEGLSIYSIELNAEGQKKLIEEIKKINPNVEISFSNMTVNIDLGQFNQNSNNYEVNINEICPILSEFNNPESILYIENLALEESYIDENIAKFDGNTLSLNRNIIGEQNYDIIYRDKDNTNNIHIYVTWRNITTGDNTKIIDIKDTNLKEKLLKEYDLDKDGKFTEYDANNIAVLNINDSNIERLDGIESFQNLRVIYAFNNNISDLEPLRNMKNLQEVSFRKNNISNIEPIMGLNNLYFIDMAENKISDISYLSNRKFELVRYIGINNNYIDLSNNSKQLEIYLNELEKDYNKNLDNEFIYNYNKAMLSNFATTQKYGNPFEQDNEVKMDAKIKEKLIKAGADLNKDGKLTARELNESTTSSYNGDGIYAEAVVKSLDLSSLGLTDISGLEYLSGLKELNLSHNNLSNIEPLSHLMNLTKLDLSYNNIKDISVLPYYACNYQYRTINLSHNNISDISSINNWIILSNTAYCGWQSGGDPNFRMVNLDLSYNSIEDISGVKDYKCLEQLNLSNNKIKDISSLKNYNFNVNDPSLGSDYGDEIVEQLSSFKGIDLSSNYIDVNTSGNKSAIEVFKNKKVSFNVNSQNSLMNFKDVSQNVWYYNSVKYCFDNGIIMGTTDTTFSPNTNVTRGNLVTILWRMEGSPKVSGSISFPDVKETDYYYEAVKWAEKSGVVHGYDTGKFGPNNNISREQLATILNNYAKYKKKDTSNKADLTKFTDNKKISSYAREGVAWAVAKKVMSGKVNGTIVDPQGMASRAEAAAMIQNYCNYVGR